MSDLSARLPENAPGKYYIDDGCINCGLCVMIAPNNVQVNEAAGIQFISKQPALPSEANQMEEALDACPTESIGADGEA